MLPIGILYEHPEWFKPLFAELDRRGLPYEKLDATRLVFDPDDREHHYSLVVNRMSPSAWTRGNERAIFHSLHYLAHLDRIGAPVLNGLGAYELELSKARQASLLEELGIAHPRRASSPTRPRFAAAASELEFPVLVKPNIGGSGAGISAFDSPAELAEATFDPGLDGTLLVQEQLPAAGTRSCASRSWTASTSTRFGSCSCPAASTSALPTTASCPESRTVSPDEGCRSRRTSRRRRWSSKRGASPRLPGSTSAESSISSTSGRASRRSTT